MQVIIVEVIVERGVDIVGKAVIIDHTRNLRKARKTRKTRKTRKRRENKKTMTRMTNKIRNTAKMTEI
jgi:hypothetical protein